MRRQGQENVKRALEIAAAGGHNILMIGPPGAGKSMLAKRLPGILPDMTREEMTEATEVHSVAGNTDARAPLVTLRPFRRPPHTDSSIAMSGGGSNPRPVRDLPSRTRACSFSTTAGVRPHDAGGSCASRWMDGRITISRASGSYTFPSRFMLVCAMNPCKCRLARRARRALHLLAAVRAAVTARASPARC
jgi:magnesium chelatase family protein